MKVVCWQWSRALLQKQLSAVIPIASQTQVSETDVDSGVQLTPVSTNKNKQADDMDVISIMLNQFKELNKRFDDNDKILNKMKNDFNNKLDQLTYDFNESSQF